MNIKEMNSPEYRHVQPADLFSLCLEERGIIDVGFYYHSIIPASMRDPETSRVIYEYWVDHNGYLAEKYHQYTPYQLWQTFSRWTRGTIDLAITKEQADFLIKEARTQGYYFLGDDKPYYGKK